MVRLFSHLRTFTAYGMKISSLFCLYKLQKWSLAVVFALATPPGVAAQSEVTPHQVIGALEDVYGVTPGERRNHTKGTCAVGQFVGKNLTAFYSRSALFSGQTVPVVARFSLAGGNPRAPDTSRSPRGMALEFRLPDGGLQHMTMLNTPVFERRAADFSRHGDGNEARSRDRQT